MQILGRALAFAAGGYVVGVLLGIGLVEALSQNRHDRSVEAGMTGFFFAGPAIAALAFLVAIVWQWVARRGNGDTAGGSA
jgi:ABC-type branched-subunit amino acid transport system permease subunit